MFGIGTWEGVVIVVILALVALPAVLGLVAGIVVLAVIYGRKCGSTQRPDEAGR